MTNDHTPPEALLMKRMTWSAAPGRPTDRAGTIGEALVEVDRLIAGSNPAQAEHLLLQLQRVAPDSAHIKMLLAGFYCEYDQHSRALPLLDAVLAIDAQFVPALARKAAALYHLNRAEEAAQIAARVTEIEPTTAEHQNNLGVYRKGAGNFDSAAEAFSAAIALAPDFIAAYHNLLDIPQQDLDDSQLQHIESLCRSAHISEADRALGNFCVSRHYRAQGDTDKEFENLDRAKSTWARLSPWDEDGFARLVDEIKTLDRPMLERLHKPRAERIAPVFISSMPRAGSTLVEQLVSTHPDIDSIGEAGLATRASRAAVATHGLNEPHWWRWLDLAQAPQVFATAYSGFDQVIARFASATKHVCEKSINNDIMLGLCLMAFPDAFVIHCQRDPLDICLSAYQAYFPKGIDFNNKLTWLAARYQHHIELMAHWRRLFPGQIVDIHYEELVARPEEEIAQLFDAIGLAQPRDGLKIADREYTVRSASNWQVRQPVYQTSRHRWHRYRRQLNEIMYLHDGARPR